MQTIRLTYPHHLKTEDLPETIAAIGFFDGIHRGHKEVITNAVNKAKAQQMESAVISFHPHPSVVLNNPDKPVQYITTIEEKEVLLEEIGVDRLYLITFNKELSSLSPEAFINHFIIGLHIKHLVAGFDFSFGHKGAGNMQNIQTFTKNNFSVTSIDPVKNENKKVSSTRIRKSLASGDIAKVNELLGRPYETTGVVIEGDKRGRQLGYPTANLNVNEEKLLPTRGVYAVKVNYHNKIYEGMANLGVKPTFKTGDLKPSVEVYMFDFEGNIYGESITVLWYQFIRNEKKFNGLNELVSQLKEDEKTIQKYFS